MAQLRVLAIAVATGKIGHVLLMGDRLLDWGLSRKASSSTTTAAEHTQRLINELKPDVVVTEKIGTETRKGSKTGELIATVAEIASHNYLLDVSVERIQRFKDKYEEAKAIAEHFPELLPWVPRKRRLWEPEPRNTIYFEAMVLALATTRPQPLSGWG